MSRWERGGVSEEEGKGGDHREVVGVGNVHDVLPNRRNLECRQHLKLPHSILIMMAWKHLGIVAWPFCIYILRGSRIYRECYASENISLWFLHAVLSRGRSHSR